MYDFILKYHGELFAALFFLSEALAQIPSVKSNSIFQLILGFLSKNQEPPKT